MTLPADRLTQTYSTVLTTPERVRIKHAKIVFSNMHQVASNSAKFFCPIIARLINRWAIFFYYSIFLL